MTAAPEQVPEGLKEQLAVGGIMIIPVGSQQAGSQKLLQIIRTEDGFEEDVLNAVHFVPMLNGAIV